MIKFLYLILAMASYAQAGAPTNQLSDFPENYISSRASFLEEANSIKKSIPRSQLEHFLVDDDESLYTDSLYIPSKNQQKTLFILVSGVHGPESYAGAAIQMQFLKKTFPKWLSNKTLDSTGLLIVHALNPWGFKHNRRGTKNSINLNRNFAYAPSVFSTPNPYYEKVRKVLESKEVQSCFAPQIDSFYDLIYLLLKGNGFKDLTLALGLGQYQHPEGISYGGKEKEPQVNFFGKLLRQIIPQYKKVVAYDLHTGLGQKNQLHMIMSETRTAEADQFWRESLGSLHRQEDLILTDPTTEDGFYETSGDFNEFVEQVAGEYGVPAASITVEFGTQGDNFYNDSELARLIVQENRGYHNGYESLSCQKEIQKDYLELFYPQSNTWKRSVLSKAQKAIDAVRKSF